MAANCRNWEGGSRVRESRTLGSVPGAPSNGRPYRERKIIVIRPIGVSKGTRGAAANEFEGPETDRRL